MLMKAMQTKENPESLRFPFRLCFGQLTVVLMNTVVFAIKLQKREFGFPMWMTGLMALFLTWAFVYNLKRWAERVRVHCEQQAEELKTLTIKVESMTRSNP